MGDVIDPVLGMSLLVFLGIDVLGELVELFSSALSVTISQPLSVTVSLPSGSLLNNGLKLVFLKNKLFLVVTLLMIMKPLVSTIFTGS